MSVNSNPLDRFKNAMRQMTNSLEKVGNEANTVEVEEMDELLKKYDVVLEDDIDDKDLVLKYETFFDQLNEFVMNKRKQINGVEETINTVSGFEDGSKFETILNKKKDNTNRIIDCINRIVERIKELETTIYNNRMNELNNMKVERYNFDKEMNIINNSMNVLKKWSNKNTSKVIFDSKVDGDGSNNVLHDRIWNKSNLCFIHFDESDNVYGGYLSTKIDESGNDINKSDNWVSDKKSFVFSLTRNGKVNSKRYFRKQSGDIAFLLFNNPPNSLYRFGNDIFVNKVGNNSSWCSTAGENFYEYSNDNKPLTDITHPKGFVVERIVVIEMK